MRRNHCLDASPHRAPEAQARATGTRYEDSPILSLEILVAAEDFPHFDHHLERLAVSDGRGVRRIQDLSRDLIRAGGTLHIHNPEAREELLGFRKDAVS